MTNIYLDEIAFIVDKKESAIDIFENGLELHLISKHDTARIYRLNDETKLFIWTDGMPHAISQAHVTLISPTNLVRKTSEVLSENKYDFNFEENGEVLYLQVQFSRGGNLVITNKKG